LNPQRPFWRRAYENEAWALRKLTGLLRFPALIAVNPDQGMLVMTNIGERLTGENLPPDWEKQRDEILGTLRAHGVQHNDIKPSELLVKDGKIRLCDFGWATPYGEPVPEDYSELGVGATYRAPHGYDDAWSLTKALEEIRDARGSLSLS
jgi:tRNA A-37 threonylcarbamoyl transferase component Bud32